MIKRLAFSSVIFVFAASASTLTAVTPFSGALQETFEGLSGVYGATSVAVMGGSASFGSVSPELYVYTPGGAPWGLNGYGLATVSDGAHGLGLYNGNSAVDVTLTFNAAVNEFGGYFADSSDAGTRLQFFDSLGGQIGGNQSIDHGAGNMAWYGWRSDTPIASVKFVDGLGPVMDGLHANPIDQAPEPATFIVVAVGLGLIGMLRRR